MQATPAETAAPTAATDPFDAATQQLDASAQLLWGFLFVGLGLLLMRWLSRRLFRAEEPRLTPTPAMDVSTLLVVLGTFIFAGAVLAAVFNFHRPDPPSSEPANQESAAETAEAEEAEPAAKPAVTERTPDGIAGDEAQPSPPATANPEGLSAEQTRTAMVVTAGILMLAVLAALVTCRLRGEGGASLGLVPEAPLRSIRRGLLCYLGVWPAMVGATLLSAGTLELFGRQPVPQQAVANLPTLGQDPLFLLLVVLLVPFLEEILFRGVIFAVALRCTRRAKVAIVLQALSFALLHDQGWLPVLVLGGTLGWLYWRTRDLVASLTLHIAHNFFVVCMVLINSGGQP